MLVEYFAIRELVRSWGNRQHCCHWVSLDYLPKVEIELLYLVRRSALSRILEIGRAHG